jgi:hypothetical protein
MSGHPSAEHPSAGRRGAVDYPKALRHTPPRRGQGFLGATASLAIVGAIAEYYTNAAASRCRDDGTSHVGRSACTGLAGFAHHVQLPVTIAVIACVAVFAVTFVWSLLWA